jgi:hypothetical protein
LVIEDNGTGMTIEKFLEVVTHIGGSRKRMDGETSDVFKRKLIGRIGIGMLAVAQLGNRFYVSSTVKGSKTRFTAEVNLEPFHREDAALKNMAKIDPEGKVQIGAVRYVDDLPEAADLQYTVITVPDAKKGLISEMTSAVRKAVGAEEILSVEKPKVKDFAELVGIVRSAQRADLVLDGYYYMLWELAVLSPLNYLPNGPFEESQRKIEGASEFSPPKVKSFQLFVDGMELFRPQLFPNTKAFNYSSPDPKVYLLDYDKVVAGRRLRFSGYIYSQQPRIHPEEFKGVHIRIRNVGIGRYDKSWLGYPFDEGIKFGQVTGEIYVEDGLEPALNIDRDSFRETDVHFQAMRAHVWELLRTIIFPEFKSRSKKFRDENQKTLALTLQTRFEEKLSKLSAPLTGKIQFKSVAEPVLSTWIGTDGTDLILNRANWEEFAAANEISGDAAERFFRLLKVLVSSEVLSELNAEDANALLDALAIAVKD